jgi:hypothetical protein
LVLRDLPEGGFLLGTSMGHITSDQASSSHHDGYAETRIHDRTGPSFVSQLREMKYIWHSGASRIAQQPNLVEIYMAFIRPRMHRYSIVRHGGPDERWTDIALTLNRIALAPCRANALA